MRHWGVVIVYAICFGCAVLCSEPAALENNDEFKQTMMAATNDVYDSSIQRIIRSDKGEWTMHTPLKNQCAPKQIQRRIDRRKRSQGSCGDYNWYGEALGEFL